MDSLIAAEAASFGFFAGLMLFTMAARWVNAIVTAIRVENSATWTVALIALFHSGPWALGIAAFLTYYLFSQPHAWWWSWFYGGIAVSPLFVLAIAVFVFKRRKRNKIVATSGPSAA